MSLDILTIVGNPKRQSRTRIVGEAVAQALADRASSSGASLDSMELAPLGPHLLGWGDDTAKEALDRIMAADLLVVATPVYKATYTGLLKLLFDQIAAGALGGRVAIPVMVGASPNHALAVETHLRPLLVEVGASCPTPGLFVLESSVDDLATQLGPWTEAWATIALHAAELRGHLEVAP